MPLCLKFRKLKRDNIVKSLAPIHIQKVNVEFTRRRDRENHLGTSESEHWK